MKECAKVLWNRGLLRKGYGICHGVAGNAYGFLTAYQVTGDQKYVYQAIKVGISFKYCTPASNSRLFQIL